MNLAACWLAIDIVIMAMPLSELVVLVAEGRADTHVEFDAHGVASF